MSMLLDPKWQVTALAPLMRLFAGKGYATEQAANTALRALMLPGDVYQGNVSMYGADGRTNPEVINRSADLAGMVTLGSGAIPAEANSLRMGLKYTPAPEGVEIKQLSPSYLIAKSGGREVGQISLSESNPFVSLIQVDPAQRGKGIGSALYSEAEKALGQDLVPSPLGLSDDAKRFWKKQLAQMPEAEARALVNRSREIGLSYGIKPEHIDERLGDLLPKPAGIKAYHGSPHDFDRFDMSKIGTGEGAQAYGHGLYFAENEGVAKSYRDALSTRTIDGNPANWKQPEHIAAGWLKINKGDKEATIKYLSSIPQAYQTPETKAAVDLLKSGASLPEVSPGRMYEVNIDADPNDFLDWDKPLSEQPQKVRDALSKFNLATEIKDGMSLTPNARLRIEVDPDLPEFPKYFMEMDNGQRFRLHPKDLNNMVVTNAADARGNNIVSTIANQVGGERAATERLKAAGIPGIKYLDAGSRGAGDGSRNYVVFDDKLISIVKKYGVAALVSAGVLSQVQGEELKAQGYY